MKKFLQRNVTLFALSLMVIQLFLPFGKAFANSAMLPPSNLASQNVTPDDVKLTWSSVYGASGYNVYEITDGQLLLRSNVTTNNYNLTNLEEGSYQFVVSTLSSEGESGPSAPISFDVTYPEMVAPTTLTQTIKNGNDIVLSWSASDYVEKYNIYQETENGGSILLASVTGRSYTVSNAEEGSYEYTVSAVNSLYGESSKANLLKVDVKHPIMTTPSNFTYSITAGNDISLLWNSVPYANSYKLYKIKNDEKILIDTLTSTSTKLTNVPPGSYKYEVHSFSDRFGESTGNEGQIDVVVDEIIMTAPDNFSYELKNINDIYLTWNSVPFSTTYKVYQIMDGVKVLKSNTTRTNITYSKAEAGEYVFEVYSYSDRFGESIVGSKVSFIIDNINLEPPSNVTSEIKNGNDIVLKWEPTSNTTNYKIYQITNEGNKILKSTVTGTTATFSNLPEGTYRYLVHSNSDRFGESEEGTEVSAEVVHPKMLAPTNVNETIKTDTSFTLSWDSFEYATSYRVYQIIDGEKILKKTNITGTSATFTGMTSGEYNYEVYSYSTRFGESETGTKLTFTLEGQTMKAPKDLTYTIVNGNDISLKWSSVEFATSYNIYQVIGGDKIFVKSVTSVGDTFTNLPEGIYDYAIHSVSKYYGESKYGSEVSVQLVHPIMVAPGNTTFQVINGNDIVLNYDSVEFANSYNIYEVINGQKVLLMSNSSLTKTFTNVEEGTHTYQIHSFSPRFGESINGSQLVVDVVYPKMEEPQNITYQIKNGNDIVLNYGAVEYANTYKIYEMIDGEKVFRTSTSSLSTILSNVAKGEHTYLIHSYSTRFGESATGKIVRVDVVYPIMEAPQTGTYQITNGNDVILKYESVEYSTSYKIYELINGERVLKTTTGSLTATYSNVTEGDHTYLIHSYSPRFGESSVGQEIKVKVDFPIMQAPEEFANNFANGNDIILKWNSSTYATNYKVYQVVEGEKVLKSTLTGTSVTYTNLPEGDYKYEVHSYSNRFGESPESSKISITVIHPTMQAPENFRYSVTNGNDIVLRWNTVTYSTGYKVYQIVNGEKEYLKTVTRTPLTFTNMPEGDYEYEVHSISNRFGESPEGTTIHFKLIWPVVHPPQLTGEIFNVNNITLSWPAVSWANGYKVYKITNDKKELVYQGTSRSNKVYNLTEDTHSFEVVAYSTRFGESQPSNQITETIVYPEMEAPTASLKLLSDTSARVSWNFVTYANGYSIYEIINGEKVLVAEKVNNLSYTINNLSYANHEYIVTSVSNSFGESEPSNVVLAKLIIDEEAPVTTSNAPTDWVNHGVDVSLTATDNEVGVDKTYYSLGGEWIEGTSFSLEDEGVHEVSFYSVDKVGNTEKIQTIEVKIDKTNPQTTSNIEEVWGNKDYQVNLTATDNLSGVAKTFYSVNGSEFVEGTSFTVTDEAVNEVSFYSVDSAGNKEDVQTVQVMIDKTAPDTTSNVEDVWNNEDYQVKLTSTENLSEVAKTFYSVNGSEFVEGTSFTVTDEAVNEVSFYSVDKAGNKEDVQTVQVKIDKTKPVTSSNVVDVWGNTDYQVELTTTDNLSGVDKTFYSVNGSEFVKGTSFTVTDEAINEVSFYSVDNAGNVEEVQTVQVKIDKTKPVTTSNVTDTWLQKDFTVELTATDNLSGVAETFYSVNGNGSASGLQTLISEEGISTVSFYSVDNAGNMEYVQTTQVKIDKTAPTLTLDVAEEYALGTALPLTYAATDNISGIASEKMTVNGQVVQNGETVSFDQPGEYIIEVEATDFAGWTTTIKKNVLVYIPATIEVLPKVMNGNKGVFTVKVDLPMGYSSKDFNLETATLNGVSALTSNKGYYQQAKQGQFKFERQDFYWIPGQMTMEFVGKLGNFVVKGQTDVKVIK